MFFFDEFQFIKDMDKAYQYSKMIDQLFISKKIKKRKITVISTPTGVTTT